jgi:N-hydroxyarylamine O-acetyltransferase
MDGEAHPQFQGAYRVAEEGPLRVLQAHGSGGWTDLYAFLPEARPAVDFEMANWYTSTHPASRFVQSLTAQRPTPEARHLLRNRTYLVIRGGGTVSRELAEAEIPALLREVFGLDVPENAAFRAFQNR